MFSIAEPTETVPDKPTRKGVAKREREGGRETGKEGERKSGLKNARCAKRFVYETAKNCSDKTVPIKQNYVCT